MEKYNVTRIQSDIINFLGDRRINEFNINILNNETSVLYGFVDSLDLKNKIEKYISDKGYELSVSLTVYGEDIPDNFRYAMITTSTADFRKDDRFRSERVHQLIFGEWVKVLKLSDSYCKIKDLKSGYIGFIATKSLDFCSLDKMNNIISHKCSFVNKRFTKITSQNGNKWIPFGSKIYVSDYNSDYSEFLTPSFSFKVSSDDIQNDNFTIDNNLENIVDLYEGVPYLWGGSSTYGTDCSGFVGRIYDVCGINIPRDADQQEFTSTSIQQSELEKGDLIFFPGHVGIYMGNGLFAHSNTKYSGVTINNLLEPQDAYEDYLLSSVTKYGRIK